MKFVETLKHWLSGTQQTASDSAHAQTPEELEIAVAKGKINQAFELLRQDGVFTNIVFLLNECDYAFATESVKFDKIAGGKISAKDVGQKEWLKVDGQWVFVFTGKRIEFTTVSMNAWGLEFGDSRETGTLVVRANNEIVLELYGCGKQRGAYDIGWSYDLHTTAECLKAFKAGEWMTHIKYLVSEKKKYDVEAGKEAAKSKQEEIKVRAGKIDLG